MLVARQRWPAQPYALSMMLRDRLVPDRSRRHDDGEVLRAAERLRALAGGAAALVDVLGDGRRADERDPAMSWCSRMAVHDVAAAVDGVHDARGSADLVDELEEAHLREGDLLARLQRQRVAGRDASRAGTRAAPSRGSCTARWPRRRPSAGDGDAVDAGGDLLERLRPSSARDRRRRSRRSRCRGARRPCSPRASCRALACRVEELVVVLLHHVAEVEEVARARRGRHVAPVGNAAFAAVTAASTSATEPFGTVPSTSSVAGVRHVDKDSPSRCDSTHFRRRSCAPCRNRTSWRVPLYRVVSVVSRAVSALQP